MKRLDYLFNCKSEIRLYVCNAVEGHCLQAIEIVHRHANGCFDWLISGYQSINPSRETLSILPGKYKRFTFVHPVSEFLSISISMLFKIFHLDHSVESLIP